MDKFILPYNFVGIDSNATTLTEPIYHDVFPRPEHFSGKIQCTAWAVTPMIVGNEQENFENIQPNDEAKRRIEARADQHNEQADPKHKLLHPFRFPDGTYGIPGSSLKGMIANVYAAFTNSPFERADDRTFSFRPNLSFGPGGPQQLAGILMKGDDNSWNVLAFEIERNDFSKQPGEDKALSEWLNRANSNDIKGWLDKWPTSRDFLALDAGGGIDGECLYEKLFIKKKPMKPHCPLAVRISKSRLESYSKVFSLSEDLLEQFERTTKHLIHDHLDHHPNSIDETMRKKIIRAVTNSRVLRTGRLVFLELHKERIISMGLNFRYRWVYRNTVREVNGNPRQEFDIRAEENQPFESAKLSPRRRLFGFVNHGESQPTRLNALAGRVRFSFAQHVAGTGTEDKYRTLKILGSPKPSAYEFYLTQHDRQSTLCDWGDDANPAGAGLPRGRKFYLHNPKAAWEANGYTMAPVPKVAFCSNQNCTAEVLLAPNAKAEPDKVFPQFRFTVVFENLDREEFSNLLYSVAFVGNPKSAIDNADQQVRENGLLSLGESHIFSGKVWAHKIGHGQSLGLGSLVVGMDQIQLLQVDEKGKPTWSDELPEFTAPPKSEIWTLAKMQVAPKGVTIAFPRYKGNIFSFHSEIRQRQAKARRKANTPIDKTWTLPYPHEAFENLIEVNEPKSGDGGRGRDGQRTGGGRGRGSR